MRIKLGFKILIFIIFFILLVAMQNKSYAANVNINCKSSMTKGETQTITVTGSAVQWNLTLYVDGVALKTSRELDNYEGNIAINFSADYTPSSAGNKNIELKGSITEASDASTITSFPTKNISVSEPPPPTTTNPEPTTPTEPSTPTQPAEPVVSSNANLSNLGIKPKEYDFKGFRASKTSYEVTVPNDITQIEIYANKQDAKASITGIGKKNLQEGTNAFKIVVKAEDGTTKNYKLNVIRQVASAEVIPNTSDDVADSTGEVSTIGLAKLEVKGMDLTPEFVVDTYRYIIELENEEIVTLEQIKELIVAEVNFEGGTIEITGEEQLEKEENEVIISVKDVDGREIAIYTLVFKIKKIEETAETTDVSDTSVPGINIAEPIKIDTDKLIILFSILLITIIAVISTITSYKQRKILQKNGLIKTKEYYEEEIEEENIEDDDENIEEQKMVKIEENEEKKDYIEDIFKTSQISFEANGKDFVKKKRGKGKHS